tara:strand:+ start:408 stop:677 length:270 start_codon:yes stop_codon:yes gene_type:complete
MNINKNLEVIIKERILYKNFKENYEKLINHLKIIINYSKYDIYYKNSCKNGLNYFNNFRTYYFNYRIKYRRKIERKFIEYCKHSNIIKL